MQDKINDFLASFGIPLRYSDEVRGPNTLKIYLKPFKYFKLNKIYSLNKELELLFNKNIVISQENNFIVLEFNLADEERCFDSLDNKDYIKDKINLPIILGQDNNYNNIILNLKDAPHIIIAGTTGSGKSVLLRNIIKQLKKNANIDFIDGKTNSLEEVNEILDKYIFLMEQRYISFTAMEKSLKLQCRRNGHRLMEYYL